MDNQNNNELISIIVPIYNCEKYLNKCVESILGQTYHNIEVLLVDDGSIDNSYECCKKLAAKDPRILVIQKENGGVSSARNLGLDMANGNYIAFVDADDYVEPDYLSLLYSTIGGGVII